MDAVQQARAFAVRAHAGEIVGGHQVRKYSGQPYVVHLQEVEGFIVEVSDDVRTRVVGILHDTVEDTDATIGDIREEFGDEIAHGVWLVTDVEKSAGNREERKVLDRARIATAPTWVKDAKLADLKSNTRDIAKHDPSFAVSYLKEILSLVDVLEDGNQTLLHDVRAALWRASDGLHERVATKAATAKAERAKAHEERVVEARRLRWEKAEAAA